MAEKALVEARSEVWRGATPNLQTFHLSLGVVGTLNAFQWSTLLNIFMTERKLYYMTRKGGKDEAKKIYFLHKWVSRQFLFAYVM